MFWDAYIFRLTESDNHLLGAEFKQVGFKQCLFQLVSHIRKESMVFFSPASVLRLNELGRRYKEQFKLCNILSITRRYKHLS